MVLGPWPRWRQSLSVCTDSPSRRPTSAAVRLSLPTGTRAPMPSTTFWQSQSGAAHDEPPGRLPPPWWTLAKCPQSPQQAVALLAPAIPAAISSSSASGAAAVRSWVASADRRSRGGRPWWPEERNPSGNRWVRRRGSACAPSDLQVLGGLGDGDVMPPVYSASQRLRRPSANGSEPGDVLRRRSAVGDGATGVPRAARADADVVGGHALFEP